MKTNTCSLVLLLSLGSLAPVLACNGSTDTGPTADALTGTYDFVAASSDVAPELRAQCDARSGGDAAKAAQCWSDVQKETANEKIRFSRNAAGQLVFTSFGVEHGQEHVFAEFPVPESDLRRVAARGADGMIVLTDPNKGRLVYRPSR